MTGMSHLRYMLLGGAGLFGVLLLFGLPAQSALFLAAALACPLMMVFMMGGGHSGHSGHTQDEQPRDEQSHPGSGEEGTPSSAVHRHH